MTDYEDLFFEAWYSGLDANDTKEEEWIRIFGEIYTKYM